MRCIPVYETLFVYSETLNNYISLCVDRITTVTLQEATPKLRGVENMAKSANQELDPDCPSGPRSSSTAASFSS